MAWAKVHTVGLNAFEGEVVEVQVSTSSGMPGIYITGKADGAVREGKDRIRAAITNSDLPFKERKMTIALAPAEMPKIGSGFDLAMAVGALAVNELAPSDRLAESVFLGELALDGAVRPIRGVLPALIAARAAGFTRAVVPRANLGEAQLVTDIDCGGAGTLAQVYGWLEGILALDTQAPTPCVDLVEVHDMADVVGQSEARYALEIAAAGAHHLMMTGPPGIGKTMLARRLPGILPPLQTEESLEVTAIHSIAGTLSPGQPLITRAPFIAPHHSASKTSLVGGGTGLARPGAVSLAHRGVLFLDEYAEMSSTVLDSLRQPVEEGRITVSRRDGITAYPARFQLILAANPCPCAPAKDIDCICSSVKRRRYQAKLSGPLMDRVDIRVQMDPPGDAALMTSSEESSATIRARVQSARDAALDRWRANGWLTNAEVPGPVLRQEFRLPPGALRPVELFLRDGRLTARGADRALRLAWTLTDLRGGSTPTEDDVAQALMYRDRGSVR